MHGRVCQKQCQLNKHMQASYGRRQRISVIASKIHILPGKNLFLQQVCNGRSSKCRNFLWKKELNPLQQLKRKQN